MTLFPQVRTLSRPVNDVSLEPSAGSQTKARHTFRYRSPQAGALSGSVYGQRKARPAFVAAVTTARADLFSGLVGEEPTEQ